MMQSKDSSFNPSGPAQSGFEVYTHGYGPIHREFLSQRAATREATFLLPYLQPGMQLIDCGCGQEAISVGLAHVVAPGEVLGIDIEPSQVEAAMAWAAECGVTNARFVVGSVYNLPALDASSDGVFANTVLEHLRDPHRVLREFRRVLKPGGVVGVRDPDFATLTIEPSTPLMREAWALYLRVQEYNGASSYYSRHLRQLLLEAGFSRSVASASAYSCGTREETQAVFELAWRPWFREPTFVHTAFGLGWATQDQLEAMLAEMQAWARRPDTFMALMFCEAVGWV
jgi:ubiquinone/menaquinone biosynthesis C-methylase UbiE